MSIDSEKIGFDYAPFLQRLKSLLELEYSANDEELNLLPYSIGAVTYSYEQFLIQHNNTVSTIKLPDDKGKYEMHGLGAYPKLHYAIDNFLDAIYRGQDSISAYLRFRYKLNNNLPKRLSQIVDKDTHLGSLPINVREILTTYWHQYGERCREYRHMSHHVILFTSDLQSYSDRKRGTLIYLALPENYKCRSRAKFKYEDPGTQVLAFIRDSSRAYIKMVNQLIFEMMDFTTPTRIRSTIGCKRPRILGKPFYGWPVVSVEQHIDDLKQVANRFAYKGENAQQ